MEQNDIILRQIRNIICSLCFDSMQQAKRVMEQLVYEYTWPSVNDVFRILDSPIPNEMINIGDQYVWTDLKHDILSNKYGAAYRQDPKTKHAYFVLQLPVPERIEKD